LLLLLPPVSHPLLLLQFQRRFPRNLPCQQSEQEVGLPAFVQSNGSSFERTVLTMTWIKNRRRRSLRAAALLRLWTFDHVFRAPPAVHVE
jgi:hypothetical protein